MLTVCSAALLSAMSLLGGAWGSRVAQRDAPSPGQIAVDVLIAICFGVMSYVKEFTSVCQGPGSLCFLTLPGALWIVESRFGSYRGCAIDRYLRRS